MTKARRNRWARPVAGATIVAGLAALPLIGGCAGVETANAADATLERFTSCAALTAYAEANALDQISAFGLGGGVVAFDSLAARESSAGAATAPAAQSAADQKVAGTDFSTTNVQEAGIDEPDIVKTDGTRIFAIAQNRLYAVDASGPAPRIVGSLAMPKDSFARDMLLSGDTLLVMGDGPVNVRPLPAAADGQAKRAADASMIAPAFGGSLLIQVDVSDMAAMGVRQTLKSEARYVNARLSGTTARVVVTAGAPVGITFTYPQEPGAKAEADALKANRAALSRTTADNWLPKYTVTSGETTSAPQPIAPCDAVSRPPTFSGLGTLTVLTIDLAKGLDPIDSDTVMASGENVYASSGGLYVATNRWITPNPDGSINPDQVTTTQIHKFETASGAETVYRGSGTVVGNLLNQFSMSEHDGTLRVATTEFGQGLVGGDAVVTSGRESESFVTTLRQEGGKLVQLGQVGGLGKGEQIFAVRFVGPTAYVVTFKQTDPLYTVDLSNPAAPKVTGELKIAGYSAYLHPIGDNLLIGVGQDATEEGQTKGLQISLFDVSDPAAPKRLQNAVVPGASSDAEWDHHAFLWWPASKLAVVPFQRFGVVGLPEPGVATTEPAIAPDVIGSAEVGAIGMTVGREGVAEAGRVVHPSQDQFAPGIRRSLVIGDTLYTLSEAGLKANGLADFGDRAWLPFS